MIDVGILLFDEVEVLDFAGPFEVFSITTNEKEQKLFNVFTIAEKRQIYARNGLEVNAKYLLDNIPNIDILVIPGGHGAEMIELYNTKLLQWVKEQYKTTKIIFSVCTGAFILAEAGLLDRLNATTHWMDMERLAKDYPKVHVIKNVRYVDENKIITSAGISSGIHTSLYLVAKMFGRGIALKTAKRMEFDTVL
ncbi:DJ-1/PfpI family protein [Acinetobacter equi]|uniref:AraC family transcriptional regulator n=1 Tax=Acinetobacter equi TaxID=1324350 RepID=A0A0N9W451_9GAMM|nr:DJ-1/PfpI family protein [Acinetobacter equi]ALH95889.1 AraC family transcriptional regulator [Acinetobacter equi]